MCIAIYLALFGLFLYYSDFVMEQYALAVPSGDGVMVVAVGWEMVPLLWPLLVAAMVLASALSVFATRRLGANRCCSPAGSGR